MSEQVPNQNAFKDFQNFEINIDDIFNQFIQEINAVRSIINISRENELRLKKLSEDSISVNLKAENSPQESRCHAFYRLIGFPVVNQDQNQFYNPGLDIVKDLTKKSKEDKYAIANNSIIGFEKLSTFRETYLNKIKEVFSLNKTLDAGVLSLSSSTNIRKFAACLEKNDEPFNVIVENSKYVIEPKGLIGSNAFSLKDYVDSNNQNPIFKFKDGSGDFSSKFHIIKPFVVDPRIDFTVNPSKNLVAVPFVNNKSELRVSEFEYVRRPLIEKIIRERFASNLNIGSSTQEVIDFIKNIDVIKDEEIIKVVTQKDGTYNLSEQLQFVKYLNIIRAMIVELVDAQRTIESAQSKYYWVPIPSKEGPELGSEAQPIFLNVSEDFKTTQDDEIIDLKISSIINQLNSQVNATTDNQDIGDFAFGGLKSSFNSDTSQAYGDISQKTLDELIVRRTQILKKASNALRKIEIIMGEFSGLGLCDIVAILGALYIVPKEVLIGFLDDDAYNRMQKSLQLNIDRENITNTYIIYTNTVKSLYTIMDKIYQDIRENNNIS